MEEGHLAEKPEGVENQWPGYWTLGYADVGEGLKEGVEEMMENECIHMKF